MSVSTLTYTLPNNPHLTHTHTPRQTNTQVLLLVVSGGPGLPCSYLETLELMAGVGRQVIFYDQVRYGSKPPGHFFYKAASQICSPGCCVRL